MRAGRRALLAWSLACLAARAVGARPLSVAELKHRYFDDAETYSASIGESVEVSGLVVEVQRCAHAPCAVRDHFVLADRAGGPRLEVCDLPDGGGPRRGARVRVTGKLGRHVGGCPERGTFGVLMHDKTQDAAGGRVLLTRGTSMASEERPVDTQLREAVKAGDVARVSAQLEQGADLESRAYEGGNTPLGYAAERGEVALIDLLLKRGARLEAAGDRGRTPLLVAVTNGKVAAVNALLQVGANPNAVDHDGQPALVLAADQGNAGIARLLLAKGADKDARVVSGPLAKSTALLRALESRHPEVALALIEAGASVRAVGSIGETPLHACSGSPKEVCAALLARGAVLEARNAQGDTPLMTAAQAGNLPVVQLLLDKGADPNARNAPGKTALQLAGEGGHLGVEELLKPRTVSR